MLLYSEGDFSAAHQLLTEFLQTNPDSAEALDLLEQVIAQLPSKDGLVDSPSGDDQPKASRWGGLREQAKRTAAAAGDNLRKANENLQSNESLQNYRGKISEVSGSAAQGMSKAASQAKQRVEDIQASGVVQDYAGKAAEGVSKAASQAKQSVENIQANEGLQSASRNVRQVASSAVGVTKKAAATTSDSTNRLVILVASLYFLFILGIGNLCVNGLLFGAGNFFTSLSAEVESQISQAQGEIADIQAKSAEGIALSPAEETFLREFIATAGADIDTFIPPFMLDFLSVGNPLNTLITLSRLAVIWGLLGIVLSVAAVVTAVGLMRRMAWSYRGAIGVGIFHIAIVLFTVITGFVLEPLRSLAMLVSAGIVVAFFILPGLRTMLQGKAKIA